MACLSMGSRWGERWVAVPATNTGRRGVVKEELTTCRVRDPETKQVPGLRERNLPRPAQLRPGGVHGTRAEWRPGTVHGTRAE